MDKMTEGGQVKHMENLEDKTVKENGV